MFYLTWKDKQGLPIEQFEKRPIKSFVRLVFQIIRGNARLEIIRSCYPDKVFASTGVEEMNKVNIRVGVTAHCKCGHIFCDNIYAAIKNEQKDI